MNHSTSYLVVRGMVRFVLCFTVLAGLMMLISVIGGLSF